MDEGAEAPEALAQIYTVMVGVPRLLVETEGGEMGRGQEVPGVETFVLEAMGAPSVGGLGMTMGDREGPIFVGGTGTGGLQRDAAAAAVTEPDERRIDLPRL